MNTTRALSEATAELVDAEARRILDECYAEAVQLLTQHRQALDALAQELLDKETLDEQEILRVTGLPRAPRLETLPIPSGAGERTAGAAGGRADRAG